MEVGVTGHNFESWPPKNHSCHVCFKLTYWFQRRRLLNIFSIGSMLKLSRVMVAILNFTIHKFSTGPPNDHSCKVTIQLACWFLTRRFLKFQPIRTRYWPWQPCWISDLHQKHKSGRGPSNEHLWQVWLKSVLWFQRRRVKCEKLTDDAYPWQKFTWPMARWAKNQKHFWFLICKIKKNCKNKQEIVQYTMFHNIIMINQIQY